MSEFDFLAGVRERGRRRARRGAGGLAQGIGDDAAVIRGRAGRDTVVTADLLVEDIDFRLARTPPRLLGHKALAVSLSDIAAMGARPRWALLSIGVPPGVWKTDFLNQFYDGFFALADAHGVMLAGGDVSRTPEHIVVDSIVLGEVARGRAVLRSGARAGDLIFVTGALGGSAAGLQLLEDGAYLNESGARATKNAATEKGGRLKTSRPRSPERGAQTPRLSSGARRQLLLRHLRPDPRVDWGRFLGEKKLATAMIDVSDGLSSDLVHLCRESGVGARVEASQIPVDQSIARARLDDTDALALALDGGEDFELLFTVSPRRAARLPKEIDGVPVTNIGEVTNDANRIVLIETGRERILRPEGFKHFSRAR